MILPPATLGMLGGGQLGRYFVMAAHELGYRVCVLDPDKNSPAGLLADDHIAAPYNAPAVLQTMAKNCAAITAEFENVPAKTLETLAKWVPVFPSSRILAICQNRIAEKRFLQDNAFPHVPFAVIESEADFDAVTNSLFPAILKTARLGYDGKGQAIVKTRKEALAAFAQFNGEACVLERQMQLDYELSVVLARNAAGEIRCFLAGRNEHRQGILHMTSAPARLLLHTKAAVWLAEDVIKPAQEIAVALDAVGVLCVEFFVVDGNWLVNEIAPRPHNSGHYTLDACVTNQFEQQVRAVTGLPLGDTRMSHNAVMVNLLGDLWFDDQGKSREPDWGKLLAIPNLKLHLYGKREARPGRKMGHFTILCREKNNLLELAQAASEAIGIK